ncbi:hypothetical protein BGW41_003260 [Actinomortierella wolfii]|nr:hypothetical protein BGW41_003260 [Actinomortierella wolfii]
MHSVRGGGGGMPIQPFFELPPPPSKKKAGEANKENLERKDSTKSVTSNKSNSSNKDKDDKRKNQEKSSLYHMLQQEKEHQHQQEGSPQPPQQRVRKRDKVKAFFSSSSSSVSSTPNANTTPVPHSPHTASLHSVASSSSSSTFTLSSVVMASEHDIYLKWPHPVPEGVHVYIAGTFKVPGHGPWEKLPMSYSELNRCWEVHLDVQEVEQHHHLPEDDLPPGASTDDNRSIHSTHSANSTHSTQAKDDPSKGATAKDSRTSRFFGRAKNSEKEQTTSAAAPYRHEPLRKTYSYLYKFIVGDEWTCDPDKPQVADEHGHMNHELTVELVEQTPTLPPAPSSSQTDTSSIVGHGRSRTSSIHSVQSVQLGPADEAKPPPEEPLTDIQEEQPQASTDVAPEETDTSTADTDHTTNAPSDPVAAEKPSAHGKTKTKNTFEAVMVIDEHDMSDGEGRSMTIIDDDDALSDSGESTPQQESVHDRELQHATENDKQQQQVADNAVDNNVPPSFVATAASIATDDKPHQPDPLGVQDNKQEGQMDNLAQHDEPHPQDELHTSTPAAPVANDEMDDASSSPSATHHSTDGEEKEGDIEDEKKESCTSTAAAEAATPDADGIVQTSDHADEWQQETVSNVPRELSKEPEEDVPQQQATQNESAPSTSAAVSTPSVAQPAPNRRRSYAEVATQSLKEFTLQEAADPDVRPGALPVRSSTAPPGATSKATSRLSEESNISIKEHISAAPREYHTLSPPLTPPAEAHTFDKSSVSLYSSQDQESREPPMTPQSVKHSSPKALTQSKETSEASRQGDEQHNEEEAAKEEDQPTKEKDESREVLNVRDDGESFDGKAPVRFPSLLWSLTKATVVVSTTVVLLGLGFGRRKE